MARNGDGNPGLNKLARVMSDRMQDYQDDMDSATDFGQIQQDLSLKPNSFPVNIPKGSYQVLTGASTRIVAGAHVLIAWVGNRAVVLDTVQSSAWL